MSKILPMQYLNDPFIQKSEKKCQSLGPSIKDVSLIFHFQGYPPSPCLPTPPLTKSCPGKMSPQSQCPPCPIFSTCTTFYSSFDKVFQFILPKTLPCSQLKTMINIRAYLLLSIKSLNLKTFQHLRKWGQAPQNFQDQVTLPNFAPWKAKIRKFS